MNLVLCSITTTDKKSTQEVTEAFFKNKVIHDTHLMDCSELNVFYLISKEVFELVRGNISVNKASRYAVVDYDMEGPVNANGSVAIDVYPTIDSAMHNIRGKELAFKPVNVFYFAPPSDLLLASELATDILSIEADVTGRQTHCEPYTERLELWHKSYPYPITIIDDRPMLFKVHHYVKDVHRSIDKLASNNFEHYIGKRVFSKVRTNGVAKCNGSLPMYFNPTIKLKFGVSFANIDPVITVIGSSNNTQLMLSRAEEDKISVSLVVDGDYEGVVTVDEPFAEIEMQVGTTGQARLSINGQSMDVPSSSCLTNSDRYTLEFDSDSTSYGVAVFHSLEIAAAEPLPELIEEPTEPEETPVEGEEPPVDGSEIPTPEEEGENP